MVKITCFNCKQSWVLTADAVATMTAHLEEGQTHLSVECPKCRKTNKVTLKQLTVKKPRK